MKIAVIGAGAIGGYVGATLALAGEQITFMVRGANLAAIRANGIRVVMSDGTERVAGHVSASDDYAAAGPQDMVIIAVKAHQVESIANDVPLLFGPDTVVVTMQNGIPYWYFHRHGGALSGTVVRSVDPNGLIAQHITPGRVVGCVVYLACELTAPGVIHHDSGDRLLVGELDGSISARATQVSQSFIRAGCNSPIVQDIRAEIWLKLWGNLSFNPISALTRATLVDICQSPPTRQLVKAMMTEAQNVAHKLKITFRLPIDERIAIAEKVGKHRTSMLQDIEAGRSPELNALVGSVMELGRMTDTPTPTIDTIYALASLLTQSLSQSRSGHLK